MSHSTMPDPQAHFLDSPELPTGVTRFWLVRHAIVGAAARETMYGSLDVALCPHHLSSQQAAYNSLARRLPRNALWLSSPLQRARQTGLTVQKAGGFSIPLIEAPPFIEQSMGRWSGTPHTTFPTLITKPAAPFWSIAADECPPEGETMLDVRHRVGQALEDLAQSQAGQETVIFSHGGAIRMALAHCLDIPAETALRFSIQNLSLTIVEHISGQWRVITVNELPDFDGPAQ